MALSTFAPVFETFFQLGFRHLSAAGAWDHQLFLLTLALAYQPTLWRRWVALATVFAVGHTTAIALAVAGWVPVGMAWVEPSIVGSIIALALVELGFLLYDPYGLRTGRWRFPVTAALALGFGVVHGLGFATVAVGMLFAEPDPAVIAGMLAAFTLGVEAAQVLMLLVVWIVLYVVLEMMQLRPLLLRRVLLGAIAVGTFALWR